MPHDIKTIIRVFSWITSVSVVIGIGLYYFPKECDGLSLPGALYYSIRLFIMEHDLPEFPKHQPLVFIYFFAPLVALSAIGTAISYFYRFTPVLKTMWKKDHVVICGVGRIGKLFACTLKEKNIPVVGVDIAGERLEEWCEEKKFSMIYGDFLSGKVLRKAGFLRARSLIFASGDDLRNLEGAVSAYDHLKSDIEPVRLIWVHIANEALADTARIAIRTRGMVGIRLFDTYYLAASRMIEKYFGSQVRKGVKEITIIGFGKFGRDCMEALVKSAGSDNGWTILVVDVKNKENEVKALARDMGIEDSVIFTMADIHEVHFQGGAENAFFLCTDDDIGNLSVALMLTEKMIGTNIYVRMANWPMTAVEEHLRKNRGITFVNINELMIKGMKDLPGIFEPARPGDLKRFMTDI
ncbi:NAD-binding protein [Desulfobacterales bacterium HSG16]|nr:NAD-binding protein [Desulfobacterales bacterium HSG16]